MAVETVRDVAEWERMHRKREEMGRGEAGDDFTVSPLAGNISTFFERVLPPRSKDTFYA